jgi:hypothetical protein
MYSPGATLYVGATAGTLTSTKPYAPNHLVYAGIVERANAGNGQIYVRVQNGYELDEIHDVDLITTPPVTGNVLTYNGSLWVAQSSSSERRSDYVYPYQYSGTAPVGTLNIGTWTIKRINFTTPGSPITQQATGAWTNRYSLTYI